MTGGTVNAGDRVQGSVIPALVSIQTTNEMVGQLDACQPLGILFSKTARDEYAQGVAVANGKLRTIHAPGQEGIDRKDFVKRLAYTISIDTVKGDITSAC